MARTRGVMARVPEDLEDAARAIAPELADLPLSTLIRVGLATLAGHHRVDDAIQVALACRQQPGPKPAPSAEGAAA